MNKTVLYFVAFAAGAVVGFAASYKIVQTKYERIAQEEIESVKKTFKEHYENALNAQTNDTEVSNEENDETAYKDIISKQKYSDDPVPKTKAPYVIAPEDFGEYKEYQLVNLTYYADHVLADDYDRVIDDIKGTVGTEALSSFGEYEDDAVHVRNDDLRIDYEILLDNRKYSEVC